MNTMQTHESDDFDMPHQRTKQYIEVLKTNDTFYKMCDNALSGISDGNYLKNAKGKVISVKELKRMIYGKKDRTYTIDEINQIMSFLVWLPYIKVKEIVEHIGTPELRHVIWTSETI